MGAILRFLLIKIQFKNLEFMKVKMSDRKNKLYILVSYKNTSPFHTFKRMFFLKLLNLDSVALSKQYFNLTHWVMSDEYVICKI